MNFNVRRFNPLQQLAGHVIIRVQLSFVTTSDIFTARTRTLIKKKQHVLFIRNVATSLNRLRGVMNLCSF